MQHTNKSILLVLGMHRSGTSCLSYMLQDAGMSLGNVSGGYGEDVVASATNEAALAERGVKALVGNIAVLESVTATTEHRWGVNLLSMQRIASGRPMGLKDPRLLLLYTPYTTYLESKGFTVKRIGIIRNPENVTKSLLKRNYPKGITEADCKKAYYVYNQQLHRLWVASPFPIINFDQESSQIKSRLKKALALLKIPVLDTQFVSYISSSKHYRKTVTTNDKCSILYNVMVADTNGYWDRWGL